MSAMSAMVAMVEKRDVDVVVEGAVVGIEDVLTRMEGVLTHMGDMAITDLHLLLVRPARRAQAPQIQTCLWDHCRNMMI
jgi:hypothetical protein